MRPASGAAPPRRTTTLRVNPLGRPPPIRARRPRPEDLVNKVEDDPENDSREHESNLPFALQGACALPHAEDRHMVTAGHLRETDSVYISVHSRLLAVCAIPCDWVAKSTACHSGGDFELVRDPVPCWRPRGG